MSNSRTKQRKPSRVRVRQRTQKLRAAIRRIDFIVSGHIHSRTKVCGRPNCRCADDANARHGPYYEWSRREGGRQRHSVVTPAQARVLQQGLDNHRRVQALLTEWERVSAEEILNPEDE